MTDRADTKKRPPYGRLLKPVLALLLATLFAAAWAQTAGGRLIIARAAAPSTLDAHKTGESVAYDVLAQVGGTLLAAEPATLKLIPYLAESYEMSEDGTVLTFHIRQDVTFHNGDHLTAQDFKYTFERALDPATESVASGDLLSAVSSIEVPDTYTLVIHLSAPSPTFLRSMSSAYLQVMPKRAIEEMGDSFGQHPVGVGPYRFKDWVAGYSITLERNPDYTWGPAVGTNRGAPYPDEIEFRYIPELGTLVAALETGEIDIADVSPGDLYLFEDNPGFNVHSSPRSGIGLFYLFNMNDPIMADLRVRQAFSHAVDKTFFIDTVVEGRAVPATGPLPPSMLGYDPATADSTYDFDQEAAAALLAEAGWLPGSDGVRQKDGQRLTVRIVANPETTTMLASELLQSQLKAVGVDAVVESYERSQQIQMLATGDYQMAPLGWTYDDPDILFLLYHSSQNPGGLNFGAVNNPELDEVLQTGRTTIDESARALVYHDAQRIINENAYDVFIFVQEMFTVSNSRVAGLVYDALGGMVLSDAWLQR